MNALKKAILLLCSAVIVFSGVEVTLAYAAKPTVRYDSGDKAFTFINTDGTDLFSEFKDLMPGDIRTQELVLEAQNISADTSLFLRAHAQCSESDREMLSAITLRILDDHDNPISEGSAGEANQLSENIKIGEFTKSGKVELKAELIVPTSVGNELADASKHIVWIFTVQENGEDVSVKPPQTGDTSMIGLWIAFILASLLAMLATVKTRSKRGE